MRTPLVWGAGAQRTGSKDACEDGAVERGQGLCLRREQRIDSGCRKQEQ